MMAPYEDGVVLRQDGSKLEVGDRISNEECAGVVRYIGFVGATNGLWLGVDWDNPSRGKHDGVHENKKYFQTGFPTSGSFIRPAKAETGITLDKALQERYGLKEGTGGVKEDELFLLDEHFNQTVVEMVGAEKVNKLQSTFNKLRKVCFYNMNVYGIAPSMDFGKMCPSITDLDLSKNLLPSWERVAEIVKQLPRLRDLNVSENRLEMPKDPHSLSDCFSKVKSLNLNKTALSWNQILKCCLMFSSLEELHVCFNDISELSKPGDEMKSLRVLDLLTNDIQSWDEVLKLGHLPNLHTLLVSENKIKTIYFPDCAGTEKSGLFKKLKILFIKQNEISEWASIDEFNKLRSLEEVELAINPIMKTFTAETVRQLRIAKLENVKIISRTLVTYEERKGAEIDYLKRFGKEWHQEGGNTDKTKNQPTKEFQQKHPRYQALVDKWGGPEESELEEKAKVLKDHLLDIKISSMAHVEQRGITTRKLPGTISIQKLKTLIQRMFKMNVEPTLSYTSHKRKKAPEIDLDNDMRQLSFFAIESGDTLHVKWY